MSKFRAELRVSLSCCGFDFQRDMLDLGLFCCLYLLAADASAAVCLCSSFYHLIYSPCLPTRYKSILHSLPPLSLRKGFFPVTCRLSALHRHCNYSSELTGKKKKSPGSSSLNKVLKQCVHLHLILRGISALYCASKSEF